MLSVLPIILHRLLLSNAVTGLECMYLMKPLMHGSSEKEAEITISSLKLTGRRILLHL